MNESQSLQITISRDDVYNMNGYFSDYYNTYEGQSPDSGGYGDSYPSSDSYASTTSSPGFSFTWDGWNVQSKQGVYIHNSPYSGEYSIPYGLGSWSNPVEQPNSAYSTTPETPAPYTTPSQHYVDDIDDFFYGYDNESMYETAEQEYGEITVTNASGSTSYSNTSDFHDDFSNGEIGNEGVGSGLTELQKATVQTYANNTIQDVQGESSYPSLLNPPPINDTKTLEAVHRVHGMGDYISYNMAQELVENRYFPYWSGMEKFTKPFGMTIEEAYQKGYTTAIYSLFKMPVEQMKKNSEYEFWATNWCEISPKVPTDWDHHFGNLDCGRFTLSFGVNNPDFHFDSDAGPSIDSTVTSGIRFDIPSLRNEESNNILGIGIGTNIHYTHGEGISVDTRNIQIFFEKTQGNRNMGGFLNINWKGEISFGANMRW